MFSVFSFYNERYFSAFFELQILNAHQLNIVSALPATTTASTPRIQNVYVRNHFNPKLLCSFLCQHPSLYRVSHLSNFHYLNPLKSAIVAVAQTVSLSVDSQIKVYRKVWMNWKKKKKRINDSFRSKLFLILNSLNILPFNLVLNF
jgi:hypothetical protein